MADVLRSCSKTACRWPAAASLSYRYATRQVWLLDLAATRDPSLYDLCPHHADALVVPNGWERVVDDRTLKEVMVEPSADDRAEEAARRRSIGAAPGAAEPAPAPARHLVGARSGGNRYAELVAQLPRLAAEVGVPGAAYEVPSISAAPAEDAPDPAEAPPPNPVASEPPLPPASIRSAPGAPPIPAAGPAVDRGRVAPAVPSRELAPIPPGEQAWAEPPLPPTGATEPTAVQPDQAADEALPGQLSIPVDDTNGVVLQFELAGTRRRTPRS